MHKLWTAPRSMGYHYGFLQFDEFCAMWPYTCMILIFYSTSATFFCDLTMYIYDDSTALEPHSC